MIEGSTGDLVVRVGMEGGSPTLSSSPTSSTNSALDEDIEGFRIAATRTKTSFLQLTPKLNGSSWIMVRRAPKDIQEVPEIRVAIVGNVDAGKSTLLGVLTKGQLDDGRGSARLNIFRHKHEADSGRTSSIGSELLGYDSTGKPIYPSPGSRLSWEQICEQAHRIVGFIDLAGHEKYLKTTMFGLTGCAPDYSMLMVGANAGLVGMAREHLTLSFALGIPVIVIMTKVDMAPPSILEENMKQLFRVLKSPACKRVPVLVKSAEEAVQVSQNLLSQRLCPIFQVSNVKGTGLDLLRLFLNVLPAPVARDEKAPAELEIVETFAVPGVGTVVSGTMIGGRMVVGQQVFLGPDSLGHWIPTQIKGIHRKRVTVNEAWAGQSVSFALKKVKRNQVHKGMVILATDPSLSTSVPKDLALTRKACLEFEAEIIILFHSSTLGPKYQAMLHSGVIRQTVSIVSMEQDILRTGDRAKVRFRFLRHPEYLRIGARLVFREGRTKGVGRVLSLYD